MSLDYWRIQARARAKALGLDPVDTSHCQRLDALYADWNAYVPTGQCIELGEGTHVGMLPDGRVARIGDRLGMAERTIVDYQDKENRRATA